MLKSECWLISGVEILGAGAGGGGGWAKVYILKSGGGHGLPGPHGSSAYDLLSSLPHPVPPRIFILKLTQKY